MRSIIDGLYHTITPIAPELRKTECLVNLDYIDHIAIAVDRKNLESVSEWYQAKVSFPDQTFDGKIFENYHAEYL